MKEKKIFTVITVFALFFTSAFAKTIDGESVKKAVLENSAWTNSDMNIEVEIVNYTDPESDGPAWYESGAMKSLYNVLTSGKEFHYGFSANTEVVKEDDVYLVNYSVISMFDRDDVRFERYFILFDSEKAVVIKITCNKYQQILDELEKGGYINKDPGYYRWSVADPFETDLLVKLDKNKSKLKFVQKYYNKTKELKPFLLKMMK